MTEEPFDNNAEFEVPDPDAEDRHPQIHTTTSAADLHHPPCPARDMKPRCLRLKRTKHLWKRTQPVVITTPPVVPEPAKELEMPSPFEQEQPEPITLSSTPEPESPVTPPVAPGPAAAPPSGGAPKKNNTLLIVIIVVAVLLLCCCCIIFGFLAMNWDEIAWQLGLNLVQSLM